MSSRIAEMKWLAVAVGWVVALVLVLQTHQLPGNYGHVVCGPWGCGPPLQSLIAMHGFWIVAISLPVLLCCRRLAPRRLMAISVAVLLLGLAGIAGVVIWEYQHWWPMVTEKQRTYLGQRCLFAVVTMTDVPILQSVLAGLIGGITGWFRRTNVRSDSAVVTDPVMSSS